VTRRVRSVVCILIVGLAGCGPLRSGRQLDNADTPPAPTSVTLSIVGTNDLHGAIASREGRGGLALLGGYVANLRAARAKDGAVLLIDAGDMFQGTLESNLSEGAAVVAAYNALGYAAAAVGNHEFDFGPNGEASTPRQPRDDPRGALKARAAEAKFPLLAANLVDQATGRIVAWPNVQPGVLLQAAGIKVGIVGVMTYRALTATMAANVKGLNVAPLVATITEHATALRTQGAEVVVVTAHAGARCTSFESPTDLSSCTGDGEILEVAAALAPGLVDVIVAGHTHAGMAHQSNGIAIIESFSSGRAFGRVDLTVDLGIRRPTNTKIYPPQDTCLQVDAGTRVCEAEPVAGATMIGSTYEGRAVVPDATIAAAIEPHLTKVRDLRAMPLGVVLDTPLPRTAASDSPLGNLFTDVFLQSVPNADFAINNTSGGIRADLPAGPLTYGSLFEAYPFDNVLVRFETTGGALRKALEARLRGRAVPGTAGLQVSVQCSDARPALQLHRPDGRVVADDERVSVVTTDFIATGGDGIFPEGFFGGVTVDDIGITVRDAAANWLRARGGRLSERDFVIPERPRWVLPGPWPVRCN